MKQIKNRTRRRLRIFRAVCRYTWLSLRFSFLHLAAILWGGSEVLIFYIRQKLFKHSLPNYDIVDSEALHRGGQPNESGIDQLEEKGIKTVISLRNDKKKFRSNIKKILIPFNPYKPRDKIIVDFLRVISDKRHQPVFVHCFHGADRTGTLVAIYRIVIQGWDKEKAIAEMKKYGFHWWHNNLIDYVRKLDVSEIKKQAGI